MTTDVTWSTIDRGKILKPHRPRFTWLSRSLWTSVRPHTNRALPSEHPPHQRDGWAGRSSHNAYIPTQTRTHTHNISPIRRRLGRALNAGREKRDRENRTMTPEDAPTSAPLTSRKPSPPKRVTRPPPLSDGCIRRRGRHSPSPCTPPTGNPSKFRPPP